MVNGQTSGERHENQIGAPDAMPLVSVVVPTLNGEQYLKESLDSILAQTYPNIEVLVLDDGSTDATPNIVSSYGQAVHYQRQRATRGIYGNANDGIARAAGDFVCVYHADDVYLPTIIEREVAFLQAHTEAGAVFAADIFIDEKGREISRLLLPPEIQGNRSLSYAEVVNGLLKYKNTFLRCPSGMVRVAVHREVGVYQDAEFKNTADLEMWLRISRRFAIGVLDEPLYFYRRGHSSSSERYHHLRLKPERFFRIMDLELAHGGLEVAGPDALAAYEAHRAEDRLMIAVSSYIKGSSDDARAALRAVDVRALRGSAQVQRLRLLTLFGVLRLLGQLPRIAPIADLFYRRWHGAGGKPKPLPKAVGSV